MPTTVTWSLICAVVAVCVGLADLFLEMRGITKPETPLGSAGMLVAGTLVTVVLLAFLAFRHNWARWVYVVATAIGLPVVVFLAVGELGTDPLGAISTLLQVALSLTSIVLLFLPSSRQWFHGRRRTAAR